MLCIVPASVVAQNTTYQPTWNHSTAAYSRRWGVYSVPAYADPHSKIGETYAEWYWNHIHNERGPTWAFHLQHYGEKFKY